MNQTQRVYVHYEFLFEEKDLSLILRKVRSGSSAISPKVWNRTGVYMVYIHTIYRASDIKEQFP